MRCEGGYCRLAPSRRQCPVRTAGQEQRRIGQGGSPRGEAAGAGAQTGTLCRPSGGTAARSPWSTGQRRRAVEWAPFVRAPRCRASTNAIHHACHHVDVMELGVAYWLGGSRTPRVSAGTYAISPTFEGSSIAQTSTTCKSLAATATTCRSLKQCTLPTGPTALCRGGNSVGLVLLVRRAFAARSQTVELDKVVPSRIAFLRLRMRGCGLGVAGLHFVEGGGVLSHFGAARFSLSRIPACPSLPASASDTQWFTAMILS